MARIAGKSELEIARWSLASTEKGPLLSSALRSIKAIDALFGRTATAIEAKLSQPSVAFRSEAAVRNELIIQLQQAVDGTEVDLMASFLSDREVVEALKQSIKRGASLRVLFDSNQGIFGKGIPNRVVAAELMELSEAFDVKVRWVVDDGGSFNGNVLRMRGSQQQTMLIGSTNWTRRTIGGFNLGSALLLKNAPSINREFDDFFEAVWMNRSIDDQSLSYEAFRSRDGLFGGRLGSIAFKNGVEPPASR